MSAGRSGKRGAGGEVPRRVVALGGGTGLPAVLRGLRPFAQSGLMKDLTAVVAMTDDGGSSGRLRRTRGLPPPGDLRNCLVALSCEEDLLAGLFQHRYDGTEDVGGHTVGNLILAALAEMTGSFLNAVTVSSRVLRTVGRILPVTLQDVALEADFADGSRAIGETAIGATSKRVRAIRLRPPTAVPTPGVVEAILGADLVVLGPGSLYTSLLPNLLLAPVAEAVRATKGVVVLVANLVSERGEAAGLDLADQLAIIEEVAGGRLIDAVLVHEGPIDEATRLRYLAEGVSRLSWSERSRLDVVVVRGRLLALGPKLRHDPTATADGLLEVWWAARAAAGDRARV
jgi:uncharacterized cofD-like protein